MNEFPVWRKSVICQLSSNTIKFVVLSRIDGLKINSIENLLDVRSLFGDNLEVALLNMPTSNFDYDEWK